MATHRSSLEAALRQVQVAVLAKAPVAGQAKTRLIPALGAPGAARLQRQFTRRAVATAQAAQLGAVTLWCAPDAQHRHFRALHKTSGIACRAQPAGDLGLRMHTAFSVQGAHAAHGAHDAHGAHGTPGPVLLTGTDCPVMGPQHLRLAARALLDGADAVFIAAEDGGYVLVGLRRPQPALFEHMVWSTPTVMAETRRRAAALGLRVCELPALWDIDTPADLQRWQALP